MKNYQVIKSEITQFKQNCLECRDYWQFRLIKASKGTKGHYTRKGRKLTSKICNFGYCNKKESFIVQKEVYLALVNGKKPISFDFMDDRKLILSIIKKNKKEGININEIKSELHISRHVIRHEIDKLYKENKLTRFKRYREYYYKIIEC